MKVQNHHVRNLVGKIVHAFHKDGSVISGKLIKLHDNQIYMTRRKNKKVRTKAIQPIALYDLIAIGTDPYGYSGYGSYHAYGAYGPYPYGPFAGYGYPGIYGYPGFY